MAQLPRRRTQHLAGLVLLLLALPGAAAAKRGLEGSWHVLVHYTDDNSSHPEQVRWHDRIWAFERKGSRLQWVEYPVTVFEDEGGRFERRATGQYARVLGAWQPDEGQLENIRDGLRVNTRGMKKKSLRGSDVDGWQTVSRSRAGSASVITYQEIWSIQGLPRLPVFSQVDVMGSGRTDTLEGVTRYQTTRVGEGGDLLEGRYERDGTRHGSFQMRRAGAAGTLEEKRQSELPRDQRDELTDRALERLVSGASEGQTPEEIESMVEQDSFEWMPRGAQHDDGSPEGFHPVAGLAYGDGRRTRAN